MTHHSTEDKHDAGENPNGESCDTLRVREVSESAGNSLAAATLQVGSIKQVDGVYNIYKIDYTFKLNIISDKDNGWMELSFCHLKNMYFDTFHIKNIFSKFVSEATKLSL